MSIQTHAPTVCQRCRTAWLCAELGYCFAGAPATCLQMRSEQRERWRERLHNRLLAEESMGEVLE